MDKELDDSANIESQYLITNISAQIKLKWLVTNRAIARFLSVGGGASWGHINLSIKIVLAKINKTSLIVKNVLKVLKGFKVNFKLHSN